MRSWKSIPDLITCAGMPNLLPHSNPKRCADLQAGHVVNSDEDDMQFTAWLSDLSAVLLISKCLREFSFPFEHYTNVFFKGKMDSRKE